MKGVARWPQSLAILPVTFPTQAREEIQTRGSGVRNRPERRFTEENCGCSGEPSLLRRFADLLSVKRDNKH